MATHCRIRIGSDLEGRHTNLNVDDSRRDYVTNRGTGERCLHRSAAAPTSSTNAQSRGVPSQAAAG
jgi:hypothetical protein